MPEAIVAKSVQPDIDIPETATAARAETSRSVFWMLATSGLALCIPAWLLPWFVGQTANGIGFSPQDVVSSPPTGVGTFVIWVLAVCLLGLIVGFVYDACVVTLGRRQPFGRPRERLAGLAAAVVARVALSLATQGLDIYSLIATVAAVILLGSVVHDAGTRYFRGRTAFRYMGARTLLALTGTVATIVVWVLIGIYREEDLFGHLANSALTDNAVWMMLTGMAILTLASMEGRRVVLLLGEAVAVGLALTGVLAPWFRSDPKVKSHRVGRSLLDAVQEFHGLGTVLLYVVLAAVVVITAGFLVDLGSSLRQRRVVMLLRIPRGLAVLVGAAAAVAVAAYTVSVRADLFGAGYSTIDNEFGFIMAGLCVAPLVLFVGERLVASRSVALGVVAFVVGGCFPLIFNQSDGFISWGAQFAAIYVLLSLGLNVVVGFAGLLDLGYAAFFAIGAYTSGSLSSPRHGLHLPFWVILFLGAGVAALFGAILGAPTLRLRGDYLAIVTLGFGEIVPDLATNNFLGQTGGPEGITGIDSPSIGGFNFGLDSRPFYWALLLLVALVVLALRNVERSRLGRAWMAVREDEIAAAATGINTVTTKLLAFSIGASVSGLAGAFYGGILGIVTPDDFDFAVSVTALSTVVLGGIGNSAGAALGGVLISFIIFWILPHLQEWSMTFGHTTGISSLQTVDYNNYKYIVYGSILMGVMLFRPGGLLPSRARRIELQTGTESESLAAVRGAV